MRRPSTDYPRSQRRPHKWRPYVAGRRLRDERGISLIEVMIAVLVLTVGVLAMLTSFNGAQKLTLTSERRTSLVHRAQEELERLQADPYDELAMSSTPAHSTEAENPDYYVNYATTVRSEAAKCTEVAIGGTGAGCYAWNANDVSEEAPLVPATNGQCQTVGEEGGCGVVSASPTSWSASVAGKVPGAGNVGGEVYDFVTWASDPICKSGACPVQNDYKRLTVVVTAIVPSATHPLSPVRVSTIIADPNAGASEGAGSNPLKSPETRCGPDKAICSYGIGNANAQEWRLHDSGAEADEIAKAAPPPSASHATQPTVAPTGTCSSATRGPCPKPDLMNTAAPSAKALYDYSEDQNSYGLTFTTPTGTAASESVLANGYGGRRLEAGVPCNVEPKTGNTPATSETGANFKSQMWVTEPLSAVTTLTGAGGIVLYTQTVNGVAATVTLCVALYEVPEKIEELWAEAKTTPKLLGVAEYTGAWPTSMQQLAFGFEPEGARSLVLAGTHVKDIVIPKGARIGLRVWPAATAPAAGIALAYDTAGYTETVEEVEMLRASFDARLQLNTE